MQKNAILLIVISSSVFAADVEDNLRNLPLSQCNIQKVITLLTLESQKREGIVFKRMEPTLQSALAIFSEAKNPKQTIGSQLSPTSIRKYASINQRLTTEYFVWYIESMYQRDLKVINNLVRVDDNFYRWNKVPNSSDQDAIYFLILVVLNDGLKSDINLTAAGNVCNLNYNKQKTYQYFHNKRN